MMIDGEEWTVAELPLELRKWVIDEFEKMKNNEPSCVMGNMMKRRIEIPMEMERKDGRKHGYIGK